uniref:Uncharacterized protein n=1 Tax=Timema douglasi TaxID=61478 RepID=A0A7R8ZI01_TIMDO|nr:unnamed protein product [Timema douglasi]
MVTESKTSPLRLRIWIVSFKKPKNAVPRFFEISGKKAMKMELFGLPKFRRKNHPQFTRLRFEP